MIFNSFAYGVKTLISSGGTVKVINVGADNIGSDTPMVDAWNGTMHVTNMMRYNGFSYSCKNAMIAIYNRLTIAHKEESQSVIKTQ